MASPAQFSGQNGTSPERKSAGTDQAAGDRPGSPIHARLTGLLQLKRKEIAQLNLAVPATPGADRQHAELGTRHTGKICLLALMSSHLGGGMQQQAPGLSAELVSPKPGVLQWTEC